MAHLGGFFFDYPITAPSKCVPTSSALYTSTCRLVTNTNTRPHFPFHFNSHGRDRIPTQNWSEKRFTSLVPCLVQPLAQHSPPLLRFAGPTKCQAPRCQRHEAGSVLASDSSVGGPAVLCRWVGHWVRGPDRNPWSLALVAYPPSHRHTRTY